MAKKAKEQTPTPVYKNVATLVVNDFNGLADNQKVELRQWLARRLSEFTNEGTAIAKRYHSEYNIPRPTKAAKVQP